MRNQSIRAAIAAAVFLLAGAGHAQNKCLDERGRVSYQSDPCPGASARIRTPAEIASPSPAAIAARAGAGAAGPATAAAAPPSAGHSGPTPQALRVELQEMEQCASDWDTYSTAMKLNRRAQDERRANGRDTERFEAMDRERAQKSMARFLPVCGKYGFEPPRDDVAIQRDAAAAKGLARKIDAKRAEMQAAATREQMARDVASRAREK
jgi:hypothetical protein